MSFFQKIFGRGFGRASNKGPNVPKQGNAPTPPTNFSQPSLNTSQSSLAVSPALSPTISNDTQSTMESINPNRKPLFFREQYANLIVKGNFMTLAAKPVLVEEGEWLAHQVVEQNRLLDGMLKIIQEQDRTTGQALCNVQTCPAMTAGPGVTYTWLDQNKQAIRVPAYQYVAYVQRWITGKVTDPAGFPTDTFSTNAPSLQPTTSNNQDTWLGKASGFPPTFPGDIRNIYRQMFRCYAHIYHSHWLEYWHLGAYKELNTCFIHFVNVGRLFGMLTDKDIEPMGPLIDIWMEKGWIPRPASSQGGGSSSREGSQTALQYGGAGGASTPTTSTSSA